MTERRRAALALGLALGAGLVLALELRLRAHEGLDFPTDGRGYQTRPHAYGTNALGHPERDLPEEDPSVRRIVVLGDSMSYGTTVPAEAWPRRAEEALGPPWQVLNLSQYGYDLEQELATLRVVGWRYRPELVVYAAYVNDVVPTRLIEVGRPPAPASVAAERVLFPVGLRQRSAILRRWEGAHLARLGAPPADWARWEATLLALREEVAGRADLVGFGLVPHEAAGARCEGRCAEALAVAARQAARARALGLRWIEALPALQAAGVEDFYPANREDWEHPSPEGQALLGRAFAEAL